MLTTKTPRRRAVPYLVFAVLCVMTASATTNVASESGWSDNGVMYIDLIETVQGILGCLFVVTGCKAVAYGEQAVPEPLFVVWVTMVVTFCITVVTLLGDVMGVVL